MALKATAPQLYGAHLSDHFLYYPSQHRQTWFQLTSDMSFHPQTSELMQISCCRQLQDAVLDAEEGFVGRWTPKCHDIYHAVPSGVLKGHLHLALTFMHQDFLVDCLSLYSILHSLHAEKKKVFLCIDQSGIFFSWLSLALSSDPQQTLVWED